MKKLITSILISILFISMINYTSLKIHADTNTTDYTFTLSYEDGEYHWNLNPEPDPPYVVGDTINFKNYTNDKDMIIEIEGDSITIASNQSIKYTIRNNNASVTLDGPNVTISNDLVNINNANDLATFLASDGLASGKLTSTNSSTVYEIVDTISVNGTKIIDLNGKQITPSSSFTNYRMFNVIGTTLIINDSTISESNPHGLAVIDGGYSEQNEERDISIFNNSGVLKVNGGTFRNAHCNFDGCAISSSGTLELKNISINNCVSTRNGGAISNKNKLVLEDSDITNCSAVNGGAIYNEVSDDNDSVVEIKNSLIDNCNSTNNGGAIFNLSRKNYIAKLNIKDSKISNCGAYHGSAIYSTSWSKDKNSVLLDGIEITNCNSDLGTLLTSYGNCVLNGNTLFDGNINEAGDKDDIFISSSGRITVEDGFNQLNNKKISIRTNTRFLSESSDAFKTVIKGTSYTGSISDLNNIFISYDPQQYTVIDNDAIYLKAINIIEHPDFNNSYKITTNKDETTNPINVSYQWYQSKIDRETEIFEPREGTQPGQSEKETDYYHIGNTKFTIEKGAVETVLYDDNNKYWKIVPKQSGLYNEYFPLFTITGLKAGQVLSFDYKPISNENNDNDTVEVRIVSEDIPYDSFISTKNSGKYKFIVPEELNNKPFLVQVAPTKSTGKSFGLIINNIFVKERQPAALIAGATSNILKKPESNADNFCRVTFKNTVANTTSYIDSYDVKFGKIKEQEVTEIKKGSNNPISIKLDTTENKTYLPVANMKVYVDGLTNELTSPTDFEISEPSTNANEYVTLTLKGSYLSTLPAGNHSFIVKMSEKPGYECTTVNLTIKGASPTPSPGKDESCEKVIGPTWHWNNDKGVCEEVGVVGTSTR